MHKLKRRIFHRRVWRWLLTGLTVAYVCVVLISIGEYTRFRAGFYGPRAEYVVNVAFFGPRVRIYFFDRDRRDYSGSRFGLIGSAYCTRFVPEPYSELDDAEYELLSPFEMDERVSRDREHRKAEALRSYELRGRSIARPAEILLSSIIGWIPGVLLFWMTVWAWMRRARIKPGSCSNCGYSLEGLKGNVCPECGEQFGASGG